MNAPAHGWCPNPGAQSRFFQSSAFEVLYGGAAGGSKSESLLVKPLARVHMPHVRALILRRTFGELDRSLIPRARTYYPHAGGKQREGGRQWVFPSGSIIEFGHIQHETDVYAYKSAEYQLIEFDELTEFTEFQYTYLLSRLRSAHGLPSVVRSGSNPDGEGYEWVLKRFAPWLYKPDHFKDEYPGPYAKSGQIRWYAKLDGEDMMVDPADSFECDSCGATYPVRGLAPPDESDACYHPVALSRQFIAARLEDTPQLMRNGEYATKLQQLDPVTYAQLRRGDWMIRAAPGMFFQPGWFQRKDEAPPSTVFKQLLRYWDFAATEPTAKYTEPDFTVGVLMGLDVADRIWVLDVRRERVEPAGVEELVLETAIRDDLAWKRKVRVCIEQEGGSAGKFVKSHFARKLAAHDVDFDRPTGEKVERAKPWSAACKNQRVFILRAVWNDAYKREHQAFPQKGVKDDQVDASSGAYRKLTLGAGGKAKSGGKSGLATGTGGF